MANNKSLQFLRGNSTQRQRSTETLLAGQPFYETDTRLLYIGGGSLNSAVSILPRLYEVTIFFDTSTSRLYQGWLIGPDTYGNGTDGFPPNASTSSAAFYGVMHGPKDANSMTLETFPVKLEQTVGSNRYPQYQFYRAYGQYDAPGASMNWGTWGDEIHAPNNTTHTKVSYKKISLSA